MSEGRKDKKLRQFPPRSLLILWPPLWRRNGEYYEKNYCAAFGGADGDDSHDRLLEKR